MRLDILVPTFNRAESLRKTLQSFLRAQVPQNFEIVITVVDNNSTDNTKQVFDEMKPLFTNFKFEYLFEKKQGKSFALNTGIKNINGEIFSGIDDDVEIQSDWFVEVEKIFRERWDEIDFVGGKMLPNWETEPPTWIEPLKEGVIGWRDYGDEEWIYNYDTPILTGGHGIFKTEVFKTIGLYNEYVGCDGKGFVGGEDEVLYDQLLTHRKRGIYNPKLVIYHYVPAYRLDKNYYRRWLFGVGMTRHLAHTHHKPFAGATLFGVPRWMCRKAFSKIIERIKYGIHKNETASLAAENEPLVFAGYFYGKHLQNSWLDKPLQSVAAKLIKSHHR